MAYPDHIDGLTGIREFGSAGASEGVPHNESPMDVNTQFGVDGDAARHDMKGPLEMSRTDSY
jgi:hypothetical protein